MPRLLNRLAVRSAHYLVANSSFSANLVQQFIERPCEAIPLGVSDYWHCDDTGAFENATLAALKPQDTIVCLVARIEPRKGHIVAIEAMRRRNLHHRQDFKFVFAGRAVDEAYTTEVIRLCKGSPTTFIYAGEISRRDVRLLYRRSRALVLAAQPERDRIEGFGLVITEAGAQGCPSVATRLGGIEDALAPGRTGFLCAHDDIDGIGDAIVRLLDDDALHESFAVSAREFARKMTWDNVVERTLQRSAQLPRSE